MIGLIASIGVSTTLVYTSPADCKMAITVVTNAPAGAQLTLNGVAIAQWGTAAGTGVSATDPCSDTQYLYLGAGQQVTFVTSGATYAHFSAYEE
jgi:hypothetical protein